MVVRAWLARRYARNALGRFGLRLLGRLESDGDYTKVAVYVWTKHNVAPDYVTRAPLSDVRQDFEARGFTQLDLLTPWRDLVRDLAAGRPLALPGEEGTKAEAARSVAAARRPLPRPFPARVGLRVLEWRAHRTSYGPLWDRPGVDAAVWAHHEAAPCWKQLRPARARVLNPIRGLGAAGEGRVRFGGCLLDAGPLRRSLAEVGAGGGDGGILLLFLRRAGHPGGVGRPPRPHRQRLHS